MGYNLKYKVEEEYKDLVNDIIKFVTILIVLNLLMFISNPIENVFLGNTYLKLIIYIILGLTTYWLVISKVIQFD
jgi:hypothetical protein